MASMDERWDVAIVGAGAVGLAVAVQLRRRGVERVVVLDRNPSPGMGSTGRANGGVRAQFATPSNIAFSQYTIAGLAALDAAHGGAVGYRPIGYLFLAGTDESAAALQGSFELQRSLRVPVQWLTPARAGALAPCIRADGLRAATFCRSDGIIDPHGVVAALHAEARGLSVRCLMGCSVTDFEAAADGVEVRCSDRSLLAAAVVNAAGPQARAVAAMAGVDIPVSPQRSNLACTEPVPGLPSSLPMCVDLDTGVLIRREGGGVLIGYTDLAEPSTEDTAFDPRFLTQVAARAGNRFPFLEDVAVDTRKCWAGLYPETPDHSAVIGASAGAPWLIHCAGFGGHGIMHCLAAGQAVAELVTDQHCLTFDLTAFRPERFADGSAAAETAVL